MCHDRFFFLSLKTLLNVLQFSKQAQCLSEAQQSHHGQFPPQGIGLEHTVSATLSRAKGFLG